MAAPTLADIRAAIKTTLEGVTAIGVVNDYERYVKTPAAFLALYKATISGSDQIRGWFIQYLGSRVTTPGLGRYVVRHSWRIRGYMAIEDASASEKTFDNLTEAIRTAFLASESLGVTGLSVVTDEGRGTGPAGAQVQEKSAVLFAGVLCHAADLRLQTEHSQ